MFISSKALSTGQMASQKKLKHHFIHGLIVCTDDDSIWNVRRRSFDSSVYIFLLIHSYFLDLCLSFAFIFYIILSLFLSHSIHIFTHSFLALSISFSPPSFAQLPLPFSSVCSNSTYISGYLRLYVHAYVYVYVYAYPVGFYTCMLALVYYYINYASLCRCDYVCVRVFVCVRV